MQSVHSNLACKVEPSKLSTSVPKKHKGHTKNKKEGGRVEMNTESVPNTSAPTAEATVPKRVTPPDSPACTRLRFIRSNGGVFESTPISEDKESTKLAETQTREIKRKVWFFKIPKRISARQGKSPLTKISVKSLPLVLATTEETSCFFIFCTSVQASITK